ncbi:MAG: 30S ribosomal protein S3 [Candidatus Nanohaloarchaea archaeon]|nr:30S ribosomal protein S3 [Candidatus Nanohaloarchaea archaeon]
MIEKEFIQRGITKAKLEEFLERELRTANYSHIDITKTPTSTNITIYAEKPGLVIGRGGSRINEIIDALEDDFGIENPQVDAQEVEEPDLDANVVAKNVASWLEKGGHPKRVGNTYMRRVMESGAVGVEIEISGKLSGSRGRSEKFIDGYVKKCGDTAKDYVQKAYEKAVTKPGALGVKVRIMKDMPEHMKITLEEEEEEPVEPSEEKAEVDYEDLVEENISDIKDRVEEEDLDPKNVLEAERENKDRVTLVEWLQGRISGESSGEEEQGEEVDYGGVVSGTVDEVKEAVEEEGLDPEKVLEAEQTNKDRVTLTEWLQNRVDD